MKKILAALALLLFAQLAHAQAGQPVNCSPGVPCSITGPSATGIGDPLWLAFGKLNSVRVHFVDATAPQFGADPTGTFDSTAAINLALSTKVNGQWPDVFLPPGTYKISNTLTTGHGGCLFGQDRINTTLLLSANFSPSATSVITTNYQPNGFPVQVSEYAYRYVTCIHDLTILGQQPVGFSTTSTATFTAGATAITIPAGTAPTVGYIVGDNSVSTFPIPHLTHVASVTGTGPYTVNLDKALVGTVTSGDQIVFNPGRAAIKALGVCNATLTGTGCIYPTFIDTGGFALHAWNLVLSGGYDCINVHQGLMFLDTIDFGCLDIGLQQDGTTDYSTITSLRFHPAYGWNGFASAGNVDDIFWDGTQVWAMVIGRSDGLAGNLIGTFGCGIHITSNANISGGNWRFHGLFLDGPGGIMHVDGGFFMIEGFGISGTDTIGGGYAYNQTSGEVRITHGEFSAQQSFISLPVKEVQLAGSSGTELHISDTSWGTGVEVNYLNVTGGIAEVHHNFVQVVAGLLTTTPFTQSGGQIQFYDNYGVPGGGGNGNLITVSADNFLNRVSGNNFVNYGITFPASPQGYYQPLVLTSLGNLAIASTSATVATGASPLTINNTNSAGTATTTYCNDTGSKCDVIGVWGSTNGFANVHGVFSIDSAPFIVGAGAVLCNQANVDGSWQNLCGKLFSGLPTCNAGETGAMLYITNGTASPAYLAAAAGGGTTVTPVFCNGTAWVNH